MRIDIMILVISPEASKAGSDPRKKGKTYGRNRAGGRGRTLGDPSRLFSSFLFFSFSLSISY